MDTKHLKAAVLGMALLALPLTVCAQSEPGTAPETMNPRNANPGPTSSQTVPGTSTNQMTPGVSRPNSGAFAQDTSANGGSGSDASATRDKMFLRKAAEGGMAEVQLGQLAAQKASNDDVKKFGQQMVDDHTALNNDMKPFADNLGVMTPKQLSKKDQAEYDKLNGLSGADFDKEYLTYMTKDHHKDLQEFRSEAASTSDQSLKQAVMKGEKVIAMHARMVHKLDASNGVTAGGNSTQR